MKISGEVGQLDPSARGPADRGRPRRRKGLDPAGRLLAWAPLLSLLLAAACLCGCDLASGNYRIIHSLTSAYVSNGTSADAMKIDLTEEKDFQTHQDKILSVDEAGFTLRVRNPGANDVRFRLWLSPVPLGTDPDSIRGDERAQPVLQVLVVPAGTTVVLSYEQSLSLEENPGFLKKTVRLGTFYLYALSDASDFELTLDQVTAVVILTARL